jgi:hypothetical protein
MSVEERGAAWSVECLIKSFKDFGLSENDQCVFMHFYYWGYVLNSLLWKSDQLVD